MPIIRLIFSAVCAEACDHRQNFALKGRVSPRLQVAIYRKSHADMPKNLTVVLSLVETRKNQLSAPNIYVLSEINTS